MMFIKKEIPYYMNIDFSTMEKGDCLTVQNTILGKSGKSKIIKIAKKYGVDLVVDEGCYSTDFFFDKKTSFSKEKCNTNDIIDDIRRGNNKLSSLSSKYGRAVIIKLCDDGIITKNKSNGYDRGRPYYFFTLA